MTASKLSDLPRFDGSRGLSPLIVFDEPAQDIRVDEEVVDVVAAEIEMPSAVPDPVSIDHDEFRAEAQRALKSLVSATQSVEASAAQKITRAIAQIATELFPRLSSDFLAGELTQHLPELIRILPPVAKIEAAPKIAEHLIFASSSMGNWPDNWVIDVSEHHAETRVQILWGQGGLTYDIDELLRQCLRHFGEHLIETREK